MALNNQIRVISNNYVRESELSIDPPEAAVAGMPVANLQNSNRTRSFRSTAIDEDGFSISGELAASRRVSAVVLYGHNLKIGDQWRVRLWTGPGQTGAVTDSGWMAALAPKTAGELDWGVDTLSATVFDDWSGLAYSVVWLGAVVSQSYEVEIISVDNPDGFVDINQMILGRAMSPRRNFSFGYELDYFDTSTYSLTEGGSTRSEPGVFGRVISITLPKLGTDERSAWADFLRQALQYQELFISLFPERGGKLERDYSMVCMSLSHSALKNVHSNKFTSTYKFQEI